MARLKVKYTEEIAPALMNKFQYKSVMQIPKLSKVIVNVGCGESKNNAKEIEAICKDMQYLGLEIDEEKNLLKNDGSIRDITGKNSKVRVLIIPTNEELVIARETLALV